MTNMESMEDLDVKTKKASSLVPPNKAFQITVCTTYYSFEIGFLSEEFESWRRET